MRAVPQLAVDFIMDAEALRLESYQDDGGTWTVGYGHTGKVHAGLRISRADAEAFLRDDLRTAASRLAAWVKREVIDELTDHQYGALLSFVFNLGADGQWTIWKRLNARQFDQVPVELMRFVYCKKTKLQGLVNRRAAEVVLWSTSEPGSAADAPPSSFTRAESTQPVTSSPIALLKQPAFLATAGSLVLAAPGLLSKAVELLTPLAAQSPQLRAAVELLAHLSPLAAALAGFVLYLQQRQAKQ